LVFIGWRKITASLVARKRKLQVKGEWIDLKQETGVQKNPKSVCSARYGTFTFIADKGQCSNTTETE